MVRFAKAISIVVLGLSVISLRLVHGADDEVAPKHPKVVRVAAVNTTLSSGLLQHLVPAFEKQSGLRVEFLLADRVSEGKEGRGSEIFEAAQSGMADLVIAHYGKSNVQPFVSDGFGEFPRLVFANQSALLGPPNDPAKVVGMDDATEAFKKIEKSGAIFLVNNLDGQRYLSEMLWNGAGRPDKGDWYVEGTEQKARAVRDAEKRGAYVLFGVYPFLQFKEKHNSKMKILVWKDSMLQRPMATIVVRPDRVPGVNHGGAKALESFLLSAPVQARIKLFRMPGTDRQYWWPCARGNNPKELSLK
jgi:tungstate transport system substrate-binding protein